MEKEKLLFGSPAEITLDHKQLLRTHWTSKYQSKEEKSSMNATSIDTTFQDVLLKRKTEQAIISYTTTSLQQKCPSSILGPILIRCLPVGCCYRQVFLFQFRNLRKFVLIVRLMIVRPATFSRQSTQFSDIVVNLPIDCYYRILQLRHYVDKLLLMLSFRNKILDVIET